MSVCYPDTTNWGSFAFPTDMTDELLTRKHLAEALAWTAFQTLTAKSVSICPVTVRPSNRGCRFGTYYIAPVQGAGPFRPHIAVNGEWVNSWSDDDYVDEILLPGPVGRVEEVVIDGIVLDPTAYRVDDNYRLVRQDGAGWPTGQNMNLPAGESGTFTVTYLQGAAPDELVDYAVGVLAVEFWKAASGDKKCRLSTTVSSITRLGVTYDMELSMFEGGKTGITEVDGVIARYNPFKLKSRPVVASPDSLRENRRTTSGKGQPTYGFGQGGYGY